MATLRLQYPDALAEEGFRLLHPVSGEQYTQDERHLVGTCRSIAGRPKWCVEAAEHGTRFLREKHRDADGNGFYLVVDEHGERRDATRSAYGHAFVLLAVARALQANVPDAHEDIEAVHGLIETRFRDERGLLRSDCAGDWTEQEAYRGQNANMHASEAYIAAYEATEETHHLERARQIAAGVTVELAAETDGLLWEHYTDEWEHDFDYNSDAPRHQFRPPGYQPGHHVEWAKLLGLLDRYETDPATQPSGFSADENWYTRAKELFEVAIDLGWTDGGFVFTVESDGDIIVPDRYGWALAEGFGAAVALTERADARGDDEAAFRFDEWGKRFRSLTDVYRGPAGLWYEKRLPEDVGGDPIPPKPPGVGPDYHPAGAFFESWRSNRLMMARE